MRPLIVHKWYPSLQAQTVANFYLAFDLDLAIIPVLNKVDLPAADPPRVAADIATAFDLPEASVLQCSAKAGTGIEPLLRAVVERIPPPGGDPKALFRLLLFDAKADEYRGVVCLVLVKDGVVKVGDRIRSAFSGETYDVLEVRPPVSRRPFRD
jgi:translation factor GUF1, mitochondrial